MVSLDTAGLWSSDIRFSCSSESVQRAAPAGTSLQARRVMRASRAGVTFAGCPLRGRSEVV